MKFKYFCVGFVYYTYFCILSGVIGANTSLSEVPVGLEASDEVLRGSKNLEKYNLDYSTSTEYDDSVNNVFNISALHALRFATVCETPSHEPAFCVEIQQCPVLLNTSKHKKYQPYLEQSRCGPKNENQKNFKVCCGKYNNFRNVSTHSAEGSGVATKQCGTQKKIMRGRIVGGTEAVLGEFPWMARIVHKNDYGIKSYGCAGFLIDKKVVVTAGHCFNSTFSRIRGPPHSILLGEHNVETKVDCSPGGTFCADPPQVLRINKIVVHENYSQSSQHHHNDIALVYLSKPAKFSEYVQPICLLKESNQPVRKYYISGWGKTETKESSPVKLKADLDPFDNEQCADKFRLLSLEIDDTQICAGGEKLKDSCTGDSGGPLMMTPDGHTFYAAGLVSYGISCGMEGWPGVYTNIPSFIQWIENEKLKLSFSNRMARIRRKKNKQKSTTVPPGTENI